MVVHIAPIGRDTKHVEEWLREVTPVTNVYLIHSKKKDEIDDYSKNARDLEKKLKKDYAGIQVQRHLIDNPLGMDDTMDAISEIIAKEKDVERQEFAINVTGGTNVMAAGAILQAMLLGTKAYYVLNRKRNPGQKKYVTELPIPSIGIAKMNDTQQRVLDFISKGYFILTNPKTDKIIIKEGPGVITNQELLEKLKLQKVIKSGTRKRQQGATKVNAVIKKLIEKGYVEKIHGVEFLKSIGGNNYVQQINDSAVKYKITPAGMRQARNAIMLKE